jgi:hypothetical protein
MGVIAEDLEPIGVVLRNDEEKRAVDVNMDAMVLLWQSAAGISNKTVCTQDTGAADPKTP